MSQASIRTTAKRRLVALLLRAPVLGDVQVVYGWTGPTPQRDHIRVGAPPTTGTVNIPVFQAGRKQRDDRFSLSVYILAAVPGRSHEEAEERCEELYGAIEDVLAEDPSLGDLDGVIDAVLGTVDGPDSDPTDQGALGFLRATVDVHARLT